MSDSVRVLIKTIDRYDRKLNAQFLETFINDIADNAGKTTVLREYYVDYECDDEINYRLRSEDGVNLYRPEWRCGHSEELFDMMFMRLTIEPPKLDEDLFKI